MPKAGHYQSKLRELQTIPCAAINTQALAERVYYMYLAQQEQISAQRQEIDALKAALGDKAKAIPAPQPMFSEADDPCCCVNGQSPPGCPPICVKCE